MRKLPQCPETLRFCRWRRQTSCSLLMNPLRWNTTERKEAASIGNSCHCLHWKPCWCQRHFLREFWLRLCWDLLLYWTTFFLRFVLTGSRQVSSSQVLGRDWFQAWPTASRRGLISYPAYNCFVQQKSYSAASKVSRDIRSTFSRWPDLGDTGLGSSAHIQYLVLWETSTGDDFEVCACRNL